MPASRPATRTTPTSTAPTQEGIGVYQVTHKNGERFSVAKGYLTPNLGRPNLTVVTSAHTNRILFDGRRASGVEVRVGGETRTYAGARARCCSRPARCSRRSC